MTSRAKSAGLLDSLSGDNKISETPDKGKSNEKEKEGAEGEEGDDCENFWVEGPLFL